MNFNLSPNTDDFYSYYTSAPTSPRRCYNLNGYFFLSMPTSPTRLTSGSGTPKTTEFRSPYNDNFEFEGSRRFDPCDNGSEYSQELSMAYADELFSNGKMLPLRPPPKARNVRPDRTRRASSTASSPGSRASVLKVPFLRQRSLWNDQYDPFIAALNKVKEEHGEVSNKVNHGQLRRAKSLSPFRLAHGPSRWSSRNDNKLGRGPNAWMVGNSTWRYGDSPSTVDPLRPIEKFKDGNEKYGTSESRKQRIKKFLMKNASFGKENEDKKEQENALLLRKLQYSGRLSSTKSNKLLRISKEMKSLMKHKARLLFCLAKGFGIKCSRKLS